MKQAALEKLMKDITVDNIKKYPELYELYMLYIDRKHIEKPTNKDLKFFIEDVISCDNLYNKR